MKRYKVSRVCTGGGDGMPCDLVVVVVVVVNSHHSLFSSLAHHCPVSPLPPVSHYQPVTSAGSINP
ncbi:hypothetical protein E2C01_072050 [Portunus trituberculatus]|uniref:Uncharacterized protein n=1 Tax=Portunus trituberculatus TaxID=210409 RepID=A0A5B7I5I8_PORTR|nr:hypothetical protein [Portunus trituberculatus]